MINDDHVLQLQWDGSKVDAGFKQLENKFKQLSQSFSYPDFSDKPKTRTSKEGSKPKSQLTDVSRVIQQARIDKARVDTEAKILSLQKIGSKEAEANINDLRQAIKRLDKAEQSLKKTVSRSDNSFKEYTEQLSKAKLQMSQVSHQTRSLTRDFNAQKFASGGLVQSLKNQARSWISVFAIIAGARHLKQTAQDMEGIQTSALLASGSAKQSAEDLKFVDELTERLGLRFKDTSKAFATFNVAAISGGVEAEKARQVFVHLSEGLAASGANAESAKLAFLGFRQMISGSVVQAQEINQVVDQVPAFMGAATAALKEMGIGYKDHLEGDGKSFKDTIKTAGVDAKRFTEIVARNLSNMGKQSGALAHHVQTISAEETRLINASDKAIARIAEAGFGDMIKRLFNGLTIVVEALTPALVGLAFAFSSLQQVLSAPIRLLDNIFQLFGAKEGEGLVWVVRLLALALVPVLTKSLLSLAKPLMWVSTLGTKAGGAFMAWAAGGYNAAMAMRALNLAVKTLFRPLFILSAMMEGVNYLFDKLNGSNASVDVTTRAKDNLKNTQASININTLEVSANGSGDPRDIAETVVRELRDISASNMPLV